MNKKHIQTSRKQALLSVTLSIGLTWHAAHFLNMLTLTLYSSIVHLLS